MSGHTAHQPRLRTRDSKTTMSTIVRQSHSPTFKTRETLDVIRGEKTLADLARWHDAHANQITDWKNQLPTRAAEVCGPEAYNFGARKFQPRTGEEVAFPALDNGAAYFMLKPMASALSAQQLAPFQAVF